MLKVRGEFADETRRIHMWLDGAVAENIAGTARVVRSNGRPKRGNPPVYHLWRVKDGHHIEHLVAVRAWSDAAAVEQFNAWLAQRWLEQLKYAKAIAAVTQGQIREVAA